jgi:hypothetical protein
MLLPFRHGGISSSRFSLTVSERKIPRPSGIRQTPRLARRNGAARPASFPPMRTAPLAGLSSPAATRRVVVLPAPFGPSSATTDERGTLMLTSCSTADAP